MLDWALVAQAAVKTVTNKVFWYAIGIALLLAWIKYTNDTIKELRKENAIQREMVETLNANIDETLRRYAIINDAKSKLEEQKRASELELKTLKEVLYRENQRKKSLEELAIKRTSLIQLKINKASQEVLNCFESIARNESCEK